jgi:hypothetical protein
VVPDPATERDQQKMTTQAEIPAREKALTTAEQLALDSMRAAVRVKLRAQAIYAASPPFSDRAAAARELVSAAMVAESAAAAVAAVPLALLRAWEEAAPAPAGEAYDLASLDPSRFRA